MGLLCFLVTLSILAMFVVLLTNACTAPRANIKSGLESLDSDTFSLNTLPSRDSLLDLSSISNLPLVTICIPARNEIHNVERCIEAAFSTTYPNFEVIVADDSSTDGTLELLQELTKKFPFHIISAPPLPTGWLGKPHACHELSKSARGDILLFIDADVALASNGVTWLVSTFTKDKVGLVTAFPSQTCGCFAEKIAVPMMDFLVYTLVPISTANKLQHPTLTAATGQFFAFTREAYKKIGGHCAVKSEILEDMALARHAKKLGVSAFLANGTEVATARMYRSTKEVINGFAKHLFLGFGSATLPYIIILSIFSLLFLIPFVLAPFYSIWIIPLILGWFLRLAHAALFRHSLIIALFAWPLSATIVLVLGIISWYRTSNGQLIWRDRSISTRTCDRIT